jgi:hypothetical protein
MVARVRDPLSSIPQWTISCNQPGAAARVAPRWVLKLVFHEGPCPPPFGAIGPASAWSPCDQPHKNFRYCVSLALSAQPHKNNLDSVSLAQGASRTRTLPSIY